jgi:hypothetical protein
LEQERIMTTMEESGEFRVTRHNGISATSETGTLLCTANDELPARRYYQTVGPYPGMSLALWRPDGSLMAFKAGPRR